MSLVLVLCKMIILIAVGVFVKKYKIVDADFEKSLSSLLVKVIIPCMVVNSFSVEFDKGKLLNGSILIILITVYTFIMLAFSQLLYIKQGKNAVGRLMRYCLTFNNVTYIGIPVMQNVFGNIGILYNSIISLPLRMMMFSLNEPLLSAIPSKKNNALMSTARILKSPPIIAVIVGVIMFVSGLRFPGPISNAIADIGSLCSPLGMMLCGMVLGKYSLRTMLDFKYLSVPLLRHIIAPLIALALVLFLPIESEIKTVIVIYGALPLPSTATTFSIEFAPNEEEQQLYASGYLLVSSLMSAFFIPIWIYICKIFF